MTATDICEIIGSFFGSLFCFILGLVFAFGLFGISFERHPYEVNINIKIEGIEDE